MRSSNSSYALRQTPHPDRNTLRNAAVLIPKVRTDKAECESQCNAPSSEASLPAVAGKSYGLAKAVLINALGILTV